ncbi:exodeoxyribonuclease VII large subunit [Sulfurospirillum sp. 1612]|uniref:exodeoxyribonuclease VII large subunit n=1 Tax=Sulfurospirillum sp. 1612 TaxID=3094835 RepID=UPI002F94D5E6
MSELLSQTQSVSSLNTQIKSLLESTFIHVCVEGEVSRFTYHSSGHLYFSIKDDKSTLSCVMFKGNNSKMKFRLEEGMNVIIHGSISVFVPRGSYQLNCVAIEPSGSGALAKAYEQLKEKLKHRGYFDPKNKKIIPKNIKTMALVTSGTGAALQDMLRVAQKRWPLVKIKILDTIVQGDSSAVHIAKNIAYADTLGVDVIVVSRGGGSIEDLWGFNEEIVADAIFRAHTPIVSAVGHEIDFVISDFVADLRAPTPSAAMEMILPDKVEILLGLDGLSDRIQSLFGRIIHQKNQELLNLKHEFKRYSFEQKIDMMSREVKILKEQFIAKLTQVLETKQRQKIVLAENLSFTHHQNLIKWEQMLRNLKEAFSAKDPTLGLNETFAQVIRAGKTIRAEELQRDDIFELQTQHVIIESKVMSKKKID